MDDKTKEQVNEAESETPPEPTNEGFDIDQYKKNLEDNSVSEEILQYQSLIENQDQLINNLRDEIKTLKERNLSLAQAVSTVDTSKPQSATDILASAFLK